MTDIAKIANRLGAAQKRGIINLSMAWGASGEYQAMKRLWYREPMLIDHKHKTDDCWKLRHIGLVVREYLTRANP